MKVVTTYLVKDAFGNILRLYWCDDNCHYLEVANVGGNHICFCPNEEADRLISKTERVGL